MLPPEPCERRKSGYFPEAMVGPTSAGVPEKAASSPIML